jgi:hypothetical protein
MHSVKVNSDLFGYILKEYIQDTCCFNICILYSFDFLYRSAGSVYIDAFDV